MHLHPAIKKNLPGIIVCLSELLVGILLLVRPAGFTALVIICIGAALILYGLSNVIRYFRTAPQAAEKERRLARGLIILLPGLFCILQSAWIIAIFPVITVLYGAGLLIAGLYKIQITADMLRQKRAGWQWAALSAGLALLFAVVILLNPFSTAAILWSFAAVGLIVEAVVDLISLIRHH